MEKFRQFNMSNKEQEISTEEYNRKILAWKDKLCKMGLFYGYPVCCILEFIENFDFPCQPCYSKKQIEGRKWRPCDECKVDRHPCSGHGIKYGFIPCKIHLMRLEKGLVLSEELIRNRKCLEPFCLGQNRISKSINLSNQHVQ